MTLLSRDDRERCYKHLGYGALDGIPAGDLFGLEEAFARVRSNHQADTIREILDSADEWWRILLLPPQQMINEITSKELILGDLNRSVTRTGNPDEARKSVRKSYLEITNLLAQELWVANYRDPMNIDYRFERSGGDFINSIPGPADTAVGANIYMVNLTGGGYGIPAY